MKISNKIIDIRNKNNLTQEDLAEILCVSRQTISNWENDKCYPDIETLTIISNKFEIPLDILLKDDNMIKDFSKKIKKSKISKWVIVTLIVSIFIMIALGYKLYLMCYYNNNFSVKIFDNFVKKIEKIDVNTDTSLANKKYEDLNIYIPEEYFEYARGKYKYLLDDIITITKKDNLYDDLNINRVYLKNIDYENLFKKNNIKNQVELIKYVKNNYKDNVNILSNKEKLELKFISEYYIVNEINNKSSIYNYYYFDGNIIGKIIYRYNEYVIEIYNNNVTYNINIKTPFLEIKDVLNILNSIYFD